MSWINNLAVSHKFTAAFGIVCGLCVLLGTYTFFTFRDIAVKNLDVSDKSLPAVLALSDLQGAVNTVRREDLELLLCQTATCTGEHAAKREKAMAAYQAATKLYEPAISYSGERELYQRFSAAFAHYTEASDRAGSLLATGKTGEALDLIASDAAIAEFNTALTAITDDLDLVSRNGAEESTAVTHSSRLSTWVSSGATLP